MLDQGSPGRDGDREHGATIPFYQINQQILQADSWRHLVLSVRMRMLDTRYPRNFDSETKELSPKFGVSDR